ncbi:putative NRPS-like enzyme [Saccharata proteae CBS 121410]|uniref:NRPS-like enzyme n=1 Tax=Saccharata proteae CBS 121410 TaxID=1314787 RepID=A0A9P4LX27_9PEZI|nr:putative NRPS-like enzyme [Saccharata proteae CBS 121410]
MAHLSPDRIQELVARYGKLDLIDDLPRVRAQDEVQEPILGYPRSEKGATDYEVFTGRELDQMVNAAARALMKRGFKPNERGTVALFAPSNLNFVVTFFALLRLGYTVLFLSIRLASPACLNLLDSSGCDAILHGHTPNILSTVVDIKAERRTVQLQPILERNEYSGPDADHEPLFREVDREKESTRVALILHSSGSTGLPKPLILSHKGMFSTLLAGAGMKAFNALPWYHLHGLITSFQAMWMRKTAYMYSSSLPLTADNLIGVLESVRPEILHSVPYVVKLLGEQQRGVDTMKACKRVTVAGSRCPDDLGDRLVREGVKLGNILGLTEVGHVGDSIQRAEGDDAWNYIRIYENIRPFVYMKPVGDNTYESVYLHGHPALLVSNSDDPPMSYHSKDLFTPHPTLPDRWKYVSRDDDRITLLNGEKVMPLTMEGRIREDPLVRDAVMFGIDKPLPGILIFQAAAAGGMSDDEYLSEIWPAIQDANTHADEFAQITREMVSILPPEVSYPATDKGNIIRAQVYRVFEDIIADLYERHDNGHHEEGPKISPSEFDLKSLEEYLMVTFEDHLKVRLTDSNSDLFKYGVDSLRALQMRRLLQKNLDLGPHKLPTNIVYDTGTVAKLAKYLYAVGSGESIKEDNETSKMEEMIAKYSRFRKHESGQGKGTDEGEVAILTGATGSIGAHVLSQLLNSDRIRHVYCLVRGTDPSLRVTESLSKRGLEITSCNSGKMTALVSDLSQPNLGLWPEMIEKLRSSVSVIVHAAWPVMFNIGLESFEPQIVGLHNLLQFSLDVARPAPTRLFFCSSVSTAFGAKPPASIPEDFIDDLSLPSPMGYSRSKFVAEHVIKNARAAGASATVLRIGQVVGDKSTGDWNEQEAIPLMIRSALTLKILPELNQQSCAWIPVDTLAHAVLELALRPVDALSPVYNMVNPQTFDWTRELLPALRSAGMSFDSVPLDAWLEKLQAGAESGAEAQNPAVKLVQYFRDAYAKESSEGDIKFQTEKATGDCSALGAAPNPITEGYVEKFVQVWMGKWN